MTENNVEEPPRNIVRTAGLIGVVAAGVAAVGVAAGVATERYLVRKARMDPNDPYVDEPFGELHVDRLRTVTTGDGVSVHVEKVGTNRTSDEGDGGPPAAAVVFVHGYCLDMGTFHFQRRALADTMLPVRAVYYDQPGHGRSGPIPDAEYDIDRLAETLYAVLAQVVPTGPVILVGHSMGGMTIMAFARRFPELFAERVKGVAFLSTTAGGLDRVTFGAPRALMRARKLFLPLLGRAANLTPGAIDGVRRAAKDVAWMLTRRYGFADGKPSPALVSYVEKMNTATTIRTVVGYSRTLLEHDEQGTLESFADIPVLISCGENDAFTPASHSQALAEMLPHAELSLIPDSAHVALLERPEAVTAPLLAHIEKVLDALPPPPKKAVLTGRKRRLWPRRKRKGDELDGAAADS